MEGICMASIFDPGDAPCGVFGVQQGQDDTATITFSRGVRTQNSGGEVLTIYQPVATLTGALQPIPAGLTRELHGLVFQVAYNFYTIGISPLHDGDRCYIESQQCEVTQLARYGSAHVEHEISYIGR